MIMKIVTGDLLPLLMSLVKGEGFREQKASQSKNQEVKSYTKTAGLIRWPVSTVFMRWL